MQSSQPSFDTTRTDEEVQQLVSVLSTDRFSMKIQLLNSALTRLGLCVAIITCSPSQVYANSVPTSDPTARPATSSEQLVFKSFMPRGGLWQLGEYAVAGPYALFGYYNNYSGGAGLAHYENGKWILKNRGGGYFLLGEFPNYLPGIPASTAKSLDALFRQQDK